MTQFQKSENRYESQRTSTPLFLPQFAVTLLTFVAFNVPPPCRYVTSQRQQTRPLILSAATNIQDAVDAAMAGDEILEPTDLRHRRARD